MLELSLETGFAHESFAGAATGRARGLHRHVAPDAHVAADAYVSHSSAPDDRALRVSAIRALRRPRDPRVDADRNRAVVARLGWTLARRAVAGAASLRA